MINKFLLVAALAAVSPSLAAAQVHYFPDGRPWKNQARKGPDAEVQGWLYNLGITGIRVKLVEEEPTHLVVGHVFEDSPADGKIRVGDHIVGARGLDFETPHRNGYGMKVFGPQGPIEDFAEALDRALQSKKRVLKVKVERDGKRKPVELKLPKKVDPYGRSFPFDCDRTEEVLEGLYEYLVGNQRQNGSFGNQVHDTFAPLALLSSGERKYRKAVESSARGAKVSWTWLPKEPFCRWFPTRYS